MRGKHYIYAGGRRTGRGRCLEPVRFASRYKESHGLPSSQSMGPGRRCRCRAPAIGETRSCSVRRQASPSHGRPAKLRETCIDSRDHVFIVTRGNLVNSPKLSIRSPPHPLSNSTPPATCERLGQSECPANGIHGCFVDYQDNVWIAGNGDGIVQKYSHNGTLLLQIGTRGVCDNPPGNVCGKLGSQPTRQPEQDAAQSACQHVHRSGQRSGDGRTRQHLHRGRIRQPPRRGVQRNRHLAAAMGRRGGDDEPRDRFARLVCLGRRRPSALHHRRQRRPGVCVRSRRTNRIQVFTKTGVLQRIIRSFRVPA